MVELRASDMASGNGRSTSAKLVADWWDGDRRRGGSTGSCSGPATSGSPLPAPPGGRCSATCSIVGASVVTLLAALVAVRNCRSLTGPGCCCNMLRHWNDLVVPCWFSLTVGPDTDIFCDDARCKGGGGRVHIGRAEFGQSCLHVAWAWLSCLRSPFPRHYVSSVGLPHTCSLKIPERAWQPVDSRDPLAGLQQCDSRAAALSPGHAVWMGALAQSQLKKPALCTGSREGWSIRINWRRILQPIHLPSSPFRKHVFDDSSIDHQLGRVYYLCSAILRARFAKVAP